MIPMQVILLIGLSLFLCRAVAIFVTMRSASIADLRRKPVRERRLFPLKAEEPVEGTKTENVPLVDRRRLDDHARSIEGAVFFF